MGKWLTIVVLILFAANFSSHAQSENIPDGLLSHDSIPSIDVSEISDSVKYAIMAEALQEARLNELNLRLEMEALKMENIIQDSLKREQQRSQIDSLRSITNGFPVVVEDDTLYYIYARRGGVNPEIRANSVSEAILNLGQRFSITADSIYIESTDITTDLMYNNEVLASFTDQDGLWENTSRDELAEVRKAIVVEKIKNLQEEYGLRQLMKRIALFILIVALQIALIWLTNRIYKKAVVRISELEYTKLKPVSFNNYEILDTKKQIRVFTLLASLLRFILIIAQLIISIPIIFSIFPQTRDIANQLFSYVWNPIKGIFYGVLNYIPNLFTIIVIWLVIRYLVKAIGYFAAEIDSGKLTIAGFYPDWAQPTFQIVRFLLYAFMIAMIYPYLPGAESGIFQGVSVFVGLIVSLGSTSVISNVMAGLVMTYMRPFVIGDRIKLNDILGNVMEKTPFVTRIRTIKNEIVTVPNSFILTSHTINYSESAKGVGVIIHSEISFGFDQSWEQVNNLLIEAALKTEGINSTPSPFVHELSFDDFYPIYQINAYINDVNRTAEIKSNLYKNIQDLANQAGIELVSPHIYAMPNAHNNNKPDLNHQEEKHTE